MSLKFIRLKGKKTCGHLQDWRCCGGPLPHIHRVTGGDKTQTLTITAKSTQVPDVEAWWLPGTQSRPHLLSASKILLNRKRSVVLSPNGCPAFPRYPPAPPGNTPHPSSRETGRHARGPAINNRAHTPHTRRIHAQKRHTAILFQSCCFLRVLVITLNLGQPHFCA